MINYNIKSILFWFVLLALAFLNATVRELTYKPLLEPLMGIWAHQISSLTAIVIFAIGIYIFLKRNSSYTNKNLFFSGVIWMFMTIIFESGMNFLVRGLGLKEILKTYYFWQGETWILVLLSLLLLPIFIGKKLNNKNL